MESHAIQHQRLKRRRGGIERNANYLPVNAFSKEQFTICSCVVFYFWLTPNYPRLQSVGVLGRPGQPREVGKSIRQPSRCPQSPTATSKPRSRPTSRQPSKCWLYQCIISLNYCPLYICMYTVIRIPICTQFDQNFYLNPHFNQRFAHFLTDSTFLCQFWKIKVFTGQPGKIWNLWIKQRDYMCGHQIVMKRANLRLFWCRAVVNGRL